MRGMIKGTRVIIIIIIITTTIIMIMITPFRMIAPFRVAKRRLIPR